MRSTRSNNHPRNNSPSKQKAASSTEPTPQITGEEGADSPSGQSRPQQAPLSLKDYEDARKDARKEADLLSKYKGSDDPRGLDGFLSKFNVRLRLNGWVAGSAHAYYLLVNTLDEDVIEKILSTTTGSILDVQRTPEWFEESYNDILTELYTNYYDPAMRTLLLAQWQQEHQGHTVTLEQYLKTLEGQRTLLQHNKHYITDADFVEKLLLTTRSPYKDWVAQYQAEERDPKEVVRLLRSRARSETAQAMYKPTNISVPLAGLCSTQSQDAVGNVSEDQPRRVNYKALRDSKRCCRCFRLGHISSACEVDQPTLLSSRCLSCGGSHRTEAYRLAQKVGPNALHCQRCSGTGHISHICRSPLKPKATPTPAAEPPPPDDKGNNGSASNVHPLSTLSELDSDVDPLYTSITVVAARPLSCKAVIDTGAAKVYVRTDLAQKLQENNAIIESHPTNRRIVLADGRETCAVKELSFYIALPRGRHVCLTALEVPSLTSEMIIGLTGLRLMDMAIIVSSGSTILRCDASKPILSGMTESDEQPKEEDDGEDEDLGPIFLCNIREVNDNHDDLINKSFAGYTVDSCAPSPSSSSAPVISRYTFNLPWLCSKRPETFRLSDLPSVRKRDDRLVSSLKRQKCYDCYKSLIVDYLKKGIISRTDVSNVKLLLPHFAVLKNSITTPCRPVFDGRIFEHLLSKGDVGPISCVPSLMAIRTFKHVTLLDAHRAFLMIELTESSKPWVSFYFEGEFYHFNRLVMGLPPSPAILRYCTSDMVREVHSKTIDTCDYVVADYVDDLVVGSDDVTTRDKVVTETRSVFSSHGFWLDPSKECSEGHDGKVKTFGMIWDGVSDTLSIAPVRDIPSPSQIFDDQSINVESIDVPIVSNEDPGLVSSLTVREALSWLSSIYDPLGSVAETVLRGKLVLRYAHRSGISFDQLLPASLYRELYKVYQSLKSPKLLPRLIDQHTLHVFVDSSSFAHGIAVLDGQLKRVYAKALLHELQHLQWTIVRKELLAVRYGLDLIKQQVLPQLAESKRPQEIYLYTDNSANYQRIKKALKDKVPSADLPAWERSCISSIIKLSNELQVQLRFIPGTMNPADCLSRGATDTVDYKCLLSTLVAMKEGNIDPSLIPAALSAVNDVSPLLSHLRSQCSPTEIADIFERIRRAQLTDEEVNYIKSALSHDDNHYKDLYRIIQTQTGEVLAKKHPLIVDHHQLYVPSSCRPTLVDKLHTIFGHMGTTKLPGLISRDFYWPGLSGDARRYAKKCIVCARFKNSCLLRAGGLGTVPSKSPIPMEMIGVDLIGPMTSPSLADDPDHKIEYALVIVDSASKFVICRPLQSHDTDSTLEVLLDVFFEYGFPLLIISDRDGRFMSKIGLAAQKYFQWNWKFLPSHASPLNSWQEIPHRILNNIMRTIIDGSGLQLRDWYRLLPCAMWAYNNTPAELNCPISPADLFYYHGATAPASLQPRRLSDPVQQWAQVLQGFPPTLQKDVVESMVKNMDRVYASTFDMYTIHNYVLRNRSEASLSQKPGRRVPELRAGQHVMLVRHSRRKLEPKMTGPFRVKDVLTKYLVELEDKDQKSLGRHFVGNLCLLQDGIDISLATATSTDVQ